MAQYYVDSSGIVGGFKVSRNELHNDSVQADGRARSQTWVGCTVALECSESILFFVILVYRLRALGVNDQSPRDNSDRSSGSCPVNRYMAGGYMRRFREKNISKVRPALTYKPAAAFLHAHRDTSTSAIVNLSTVTQSASVNFPMGTKPKGPPVDLNNNGFVV
ncbi:hypothetical protein M513_03764 [Trichuris suis]|uniref:Uncharacterized protein n=1 Tax=Trichuris suis TaxID=68888 RepID=A0A085MDX8_9BILA|nr:hypothetical protein M513_03764 [Trichuris suis]